MNAVWVFDLDGTLITSGTDYARSVLRWGLMFLDETEHRAPHYERFIPQFIEILRVVDKERFPAMRAHRDRWPGSMVEAYRRLCPELKIEVDPVVERKTWEIGVSAISGSTYLGRTMIPGAEKTLQFIQEQGDLLYCVTAGDPVVQWNKWRGYNLSRFFPSQREYRVVKWDKFETLQRLRRLHPDQLAVMVGDSIGSDLWPAHRAGMTPVYVPNPGTWDHGQLVKDAPKGTFQFEDISQVVSDYQKLTKPTG